MTQPSPIGSPASPIGSPASPIGSPASPIGSPLSAQQVLDREFLEMRARILKLAASLDRIQRSSAPAADPARLGQLLDGVKILLSDAPDRARQVQLLFSLPYNPSWPVDLDVPVEKKA